MNEGLEEQEKIVVSLEQRQVTILAFGALVLLGVIFSLGVLVGRQLASASLGAPQQPPPGDLRALDAAPPAPAAVVPVAAPAVLVAPPTAAAAPAAPPPAPPPAIAVQAPLILSGAASRVPSPPAGPRSAPGIAPAAAAPVHVSADRPPTDDEIDRDEADDEPTKPASRPATVAVVTAPKPTLLVPAPKPSEAGQPPLPPPPANLGHYTVQLGAVPGRADAQRLEARARALGLKPYVIAAQLGQKGTWYRVRVGAFETKEQAGAYQKDVERELHCHSAVMPAR